MKKIGKTKPTVAKNSVKRVWHIGLTEIQIEAIRAATRGFHRFDFKKSIRYPNGCDEKTDEVRNKLIKDACKKKSGFRIEFVECEPHKSNVHTHQYWYIYFDENMRDLDGESLKYKYCFSFWDKQNLYLNEVDLPLPAGTPTFGALTAGEWVRKFLKLQ